VNEIFRLMQPDGCQRSQFIHRALSPTKTKILRFGRERAIPRPIEEHRPRVFTWILASLGLTPFHSAVAPWAVVTNSSSLINGAMALRLS
jgi:hypothetical protein